MYAELSWEKDYFENVYSLYFQGLSVGSLVEKSFCRKAKALTKNACFDIDTNGIINQVSIIKGKNGEEIGRIKYNYLKKNATIRYLGKDLELKNYSFSEKGWELTYQNKTLVKYKGSTGGNIIAMQDEKELILLGLFAINLFKQSRIQAWVIILFTLWTQYLLLL